MTMIILIEYYAKAESDLFDSKDEESYYPAMIALAIYGVVTAVQAIPIFNNTISKEHELKFYTVMHVLRVVTLAAACVLLFLTHGIEVQFGFWIITNLIVFIVDYIW